MVNVPKQQVFSITVTRKQIVDAYNEMQDFSNVDSPTERDLCNLRMLLPGDFEMISLAWLRNKLVACRKAGELNKRSRNESCTNWQREGHANGDGPSLF